MIKFLETLWRTPLGKSLSALLVAAIGIVLNHLLGSSGEVRLPVQEAKDLTLLAGGVLCSVVAFAYSYWKKCQPREEIEWAKKNGRLICECTEVGTVMVMVPKPRSGESIKLYECPKCKEARLVSHGIPQK
jgi:hypothetical protein